MNKAGSRIEREHLVSDQVAGAIVNAINNERLASELALLATQDRAFSEAIQQIENVRNFVGSPANILGNAQTKHGEIAEHVEVGVRNARAIIEGQEPNATFDGVGRTAPTDYLINGEDVQSKFINGARNTLDHVRTHLNTYSEFGRDGTSYYHIPKDTHEQIQRVLNGTETELSEKTRQSIIEKVSEIEKTTGQPFNNVVKPSLSGYGDVQQGNIHGTLNQHEKSIEERNNNKKEEITQNHQPSLKEVATASAIAGAVGGTISLSTAIYAKYKEGKNPFKGGFTTKDWQEVGITTAKGAAGGAISGGAIYALTNYAGMSAPFASAFVSASKGVYSLQQSYFKGEINGEEFLEMSMIACAEAAIVGIATALGQTLIPIPILGATIGSMAGRLVAEFSTGKTAKEAERIRKEMEKFIAGVDAALQNVFSKIEKEFDRLGKLTVAAFDIKNNIFLVESSINLARAYGVEENKIIKDHSDLEKFLLE